MTTCGERQNSREQENGIRTLNSTAIRDLDNDSRSNDSGNELSGSGGEGDSVSQHNNPLDNQSTSPPSSGQYGMDELLENANFTSFVNTGANVADITPQHGIPAVVSSLFDTPQSPETSVVDNQAQQWVIPPPPPPAFASNRIVNRPVPFSLYPPNPSPLYRGYTPNWLDSSAKSSPQKSFNSDIGETSTDALWTPTLTLKNMSCLAPPTPMVQSAFDSLNADDTPVFSPLSPTNTSNIVPSSPVANSTPIKHSAAVVPPQIWYNTRNISPSKMSPNMMLPPPPMVQLDALCQPPQVPTHCQGCDSGNQSFGYCLQCQERLCSYCVQAHQRVRATKLHAVVELAHLFNLMQQGKPLLPMIGNTDQMNRRINGGSVGSGTEALESLSGDSSPRSSSVCSVHDSRIVGFCDHCPQTKTLCAICVAQHPNKHRVQPIGDLRFAISELINESSLLQWQCEKTNETISRIIDNVSTNASIAENEVLTHFDSLINALVERKSEMLSRVETVKTHKLAILYGQSKMLVEKQNEMKNAVNQAKASIEQGQQEEDLKLVFEQLAEGQKDQHNNNIFILSSQVNEDDRVRFIVSQDGTLVNKLRQYGHVESGACATTSSILGDGFNKAIRERQSLIYVQLRDACGDPLSSSIASTQVPKSLLPHQASQFEQHTGAQNAEIHAMIVAPDGTLLDVNVSPRENGIVCLSYMPIIEGSYSLNILVKGTPINGCPTKIDVRRGRNYDEIATSGPLFSFGGEGSGDGQLCRPWGICVDLLGRVIVADRSNNRVQIFDKDGNFLSKFGSTGNRPGQFDRPAGVTINSLNHIIVADKDNHRIQVFDQNGDFLLKFGDRGRAIGYFNYPWGVATNTHNAIAVSDTRNHRVQIFTAQGQFVRKCGFDSAYFFKNLDSPRGVCYLPDGQLLITDFNNHRLAILSPRNMSEMKVYGSEGDADGMFIRPQGVKIDTEGHILVCDSRNNRVQVFASDDMRFLGSFGRGPLSSECSTPGFQMPTELPTPRASTGPFGAPSFSSPTASPQSQHQSTSSTSRQDLMDRPTDLAVGPDGRIYVVDFGNHCIRVF